MGAEIVAVQPSPHARGETRHAGPTTRGGGRLGWPKALRATQDANAQGRGQTGLVLGVTLGERQRAREECIEVIHREREAGDCYSGGRARRVELANVGMKPAVWNDPQEARRR